MIGSLLSTVSVSSSGSRLSACLLRQFRIRIRQHRGAVSIRVSIRWGPQQQAAPHACDRWLKLPLRAFDLRFRNSFPSQVQTLLRPAPPSQPDIGNILTFLWTENCQWVRSPTSRRIVLVSPDCRSISYLIAASCRTYDELTRLLTCRTLSNNRCKKDRADEVKTGKGKNYTLYSPRPPTKDARLFLGSC
jgi:hypothetical protein